MKFLIIFIFFMFSCSKGEFASNKSYYAAAALKPPKSAVDLKSEGVSSYETGKNRANISKKLVKNASVSLLVDDKGVVEAINKIKEIVKKQKGYITQTNFTTNSDNEVDYANMTVKIPSSGYDLFLKELKSCGKILSINEKTEDVTDEYYDLDARLKNLKKTEQRLLMLLETKSGDLKDVILIEKELSKVREKIEVLEGKFQVLKNLVNYSTIELSIASKSYYLPYERGFFEKLKDGIVGSIEFIKNSIIVIIQIIIGGSLWFIFLFFLYLFLRKVFKSRKKGK